MNLFDYIWNWLPTDPKILQEMVKTGYVYTPYIPLQITRIINVSR